MNIPALPRGLIVVALAWAAGCGREAPPDVREYVPTLLAKAPATQPAEPEEAEEKPAEAAPPMEAPPVQVVATVAPPVATEVERAPVAAAPSDAKAPSIVGTWRVVEMSHRGQTQPMPPGMSMTLTFGEDGTFGMSMAGAPGGPGEEMPKGTYTVSGEQITISMRGETKTGKFSLDGSSKATIDIDEAKMTLERS
jgi:hypothetical protein